MPPGEDNRAARVEAAKKQLLEKTEAAERVNTRKPPAALAAGGGRSEC